MKEIILLGGGGHCGSVVDSIRESDQYKIVGILDHRDKIGGETNGIRVIGTDDDLPYYYQQGVSHACVTIGSIGRPLLRQSVYKKAAATGYTFPSIIDRTAIVSRSAVVGQGVFIGKGAIVNSAAIIGDQAIINTGAIIEHDSRIGAWCHIAPGCVLSGGVLVGERTHIGPNSTVIQQIEIGSDTLVGAGSVVVRDIGAQMKAYGNPCREVEMLVHEE